MAVQPWVVKSSCTVRGQVIPAGLVVDLDIGGELATEYGIGNLAPLPADQSGDVADHSTLSN